MKFVYMKTFYAFLIKFLVYIVAIHRTIVFKY